MRKLSLLAMATILATTIEVGLSQAASIPNNTKFNSEHHGSGTISARSKNPAGKGRMHKHGAAKKPAAVKDTTGVVATSGSLRNMCIIQY